MSAAAAVTRKPVTSERDETKPKSKSGFTQVPNEFFDRLPRCTTPAEYLCLGIILRQTAGFQREEAEITVAQYERMTGLSERSVYLALKGLRKLELIPPSDEETQGKGSHFRINFDRFKTVPERAPIEVVQRKRSAEGSASPEPVVVTAKCLTCFTIGPVELIDEEPVADESNIQPAQNVVDESGTRPPFCRGTDVNASVATPAKNCSGPNEAVETYLVGWIPVFASPPPSGLPAEVAEALGDAPLALFAQRCELRIRGDWPAKFGWKGMLLLAKDAAAAARKLPKPKARAASSSTDEMMSLDDLLADSFTDPEKASWWLNQEYCSSEERSLLLAKFPALANGAH